MSKSILIIMTTALLASLFIACQQGDSMSAPMQPENPENGMSPFLAKPGAQTGGMIWSDGELFGTVGTPAHFKPGKGPFDNLYTGTSFKDGVGAISESKPGDQDYNGGRWHVFVYTGDADYSDASSLEDLNLDDFAATDTYFECPLLPRKN